MQFECEICWREAQMIPAPLFYTQVAATMAASELTNFMIPARFSCSYPHVVKKLQLGIAA